MSNCFSWLLLLGSALVAFNPPLHAQSDRGKAPRSAPNRPTAVVVPVLTSTKASDPARSTGTPAAAAMADGAGDDADEVIRVDSNLVPVLASIVDDRGLAVTDLKLEDFELQIDGQPRPIGELGRAVTPVRLAVLFDNSSSVSPARGLQMQAAVRFFRRVLRPVDQAAIYSVSTVPTLVRPLTADVQSLVRTVEDFTRPEGATALFDAIAQASDYLKMQAGRKVIVIVSDGVDTISDLDFDTTLVRAQAADCQIYAVRTWQTDSANLRDLTAERRLQELAAQTGGAVYTPRGIDDLDASFAQISGDLAQQYVLSHYPVGDRRDGRFHTITLRVPARPNVRIRARKGYYSPKS